MLKNGNPASPATARARRVLPVPGALEAVYHATRATLLWLLNPVLTFVFCANRRFALRLTETALEISPGRHRGTDFPALSAKVAVPMRGTRLTRRLFRPWTGSTLNYSTKRSSFARSLKRYKQRPTSPG